MDRHQLKQRPFSQLIWPLQSVHIVQAGDASIPRAELLALSTVTLDFHAAGFDWSDSTQSSHETERRFQVTLPCQHHSTSTSARIQPAFFAPVQYTSQPTSARLTPSCSGRASIVGLPGTPIGDIVDGLFLRCRSRRPQNLCLINSVRH